MHQFKTVSIIIPVFNEAQFIHEVIKQVIQADSLGLRKEILVVDDGSVDGTRQVLERLQKRFQIVKVLSHTTNLGKGAAVKTGAMASRGEVVVIQDADLEYSPSDYPQLLRPIIEDKADVVYGSRFISDRPHRVLYYWHFVANRWLTTLSNSLTNLNLTDMETGYKIFRGEVLRSLAPKLSSRRFGFEPEITARLAKQRWRVYEVGISYYGRTYAEGKKINWLDGIKAVGSIIKYNLLVR